MKVLKTLIGLFLLSGLMACSNKSKEDSCGFVQNVYGERISWKGNLPVHMSIHSSVPQEFRTAIQSAAQKWNTAAGQNLIQIDGVTSSSASQKDGVNIIYLSSTWDSTKSSEQGRTSIYWVGDVIREADINLNGQNFQYYWPTKTAGSGVNMEALVLHEMGHVLGLKHKDVSASVMQTYLASNTDRTQINNTDLESLKCEY